MTINLENEGLRCIFKPYQIRIMEFLWSQHEQSHSSRDVWLAVNKAIHPRTISRASVINSLKWLADIGILSRDTTTGKGGHRGLYRALRSEEEILIIVGKAALDQLGRYD